MDQTAQQGLEVYCLSQSQNTFTFPYDRVQNPPGPFLLLRIADKVRGFQLQEFPAVVDTGSTATCIPEDFTAGLPNDMFSLADKVRYGNSMLPNEERVLNLPVADIDFIDTQGNLILTKRYYRLSFVVGRKGLIGSEGLLGLDILNQHVCKFDGPNLQYIIEKTWA